MDKIYIVTAGDYSDYRIYGVFSSKAKAQTFIEDTAEPIGYYDADDFEIETWIVDPTEDESHFTMIQMTKDGRTLQVSTSFPGRCGEERISSSPSEWYARKHQLDPSELILTTHVRTKDEKRAIKVANERRAQLIANDRWAEGPVE